MSLSLSRRGFLSGTALGSLALFACERTPDSSAAGASQGSAPANPDIGPLIAADALATRIDEARAGKIAVFHVGPSMLFPRGHVPGSRHVGESGTDEGYASLVAALKALPKDTEVVVYCGCCPVRDCPNIRPASKAIREVNSLKGKVLDLPTNFNSDWVKKGYAVDKS